MVTDIKVKRAVTFEKVTSDGLKNEWFQCWVEMSFHDEISGSRIKKNHVI